jgi:DDE_Tnp_1-associated
VPVSHAAPEASIYAHETVGLADVAALYRLFAQVPDPRRARGVRHCLATALTLAVFAVLAGAASYREMGDRAADLPGVLLAAVGARTRPRTGTLQAPSGSTIRRIAEQIDAQAADLLVGRFLAERAAALASEDRDTPHAPGSRWTERPCATPVPGTGRRT